MRLFSNFIDKIFYKMNNILKINALWIILVSFLFILQVALAATHDPWRDEWQALQIAVQSPNMSALFSNLRYEGHPPLWYFILRGAAKIIPVLFVLAFVQVFICVSTQIVIQFYSPFHRFEKLLIGSSFFILIEYGALARSLSLGVLLILSFSAFRERKWSWLILAALPMVDFIFGLVSLALITIMWREQRLWWGGVAAWFVSSLFAAWSVRPASDMVTAAVMNGPATEFALYITRLSALLIPLQMNGTNLQWDNPSIPPIAPLLGIFFLIFSYVNLKQNGTNLLLFLMILMSLLIFSMFIYPFQIRHLEIFSILLIVFKWHDVQNGAKIHASFHVWLLVISFCGLAVSVVNITRPFDSAGKVADFIENNRLTGKHWIAFPAPRSAGISALLDMEFHNLEGNCTQSFTRWNHPRSIRTDADLKEKLVSVGNQYGESYLLTNFLLSGATYGNIATEIAAFAPGYDGESYYVYKVASDKPESEQQPPKCAPQDRLSLAATARN